MISHPHLCFAHGLILRHRKGVWLDLTFLANIYRHGTHGFVCMGPEAFENTGGGFAGGSKADAIGRLESIFLLLGRATYLGRSRGWVKSELCRTHVAENIRINLWGLHVLLFLSRWTRAKARMLHPDTEGSFDTEHPALLRPESRLFASEVPKLVSSDL